MMDTTFILKRTQLAHDSSQPHLTNKPSKCIQPSSSDAIHQKLWIFLLVLTTVLVLTLLWVREYVLNLSLTRIFPFVYAYLGLFIIFRKGKKRGVQNIEDVFCRKRRWSRLENGSLTREERITWLIVASSSFMGAESSSYIRDDLKLHWWEYWLCKSLSRMTWYMQHSEDNVNLVWTSGWFSKKKTGCSDRQNMHAFLSDYMQIWTTPCKVQLLIEQLP
jgi:hypothetical protein